MSLAEMCNWCKKPVLLEEVHRDTLGKPYHEICLEAHEDKIEDDVRGYSEDRD